MYNVEVEFHDGEKCVFSFQLEKNARDFAKLVWTSNQISTCEVLLNGEYVT